MLRTISIDMGGSGGKAYEVLYDGNMLTVGEILRFSNNPVYLGNAYCWDLPRLVYEVKQCLQRALRRRATASFAIDTWGASMGMLDANGNLLALPRHYRDREYDGIAQKAFERIPRREFFRRMGCSMEDNVALFQCYANHLYAPKLFAAARHVLMTADLIRYFLTGTIISEETLAGTGGLVDPYTRGRNDLDLRALDLPVTLFPQPVRAGSVAGRLSRQTAEELDIDRVRAVAVAGHDTASAVLALPQGQEDAFLILGTWGLLGITTDKLITTELAMQKNCVNELNPEGKIRFLRNSPGMWIYDQCRERWGISHQEIIRQARESPAFCSWVDVEAPIFRSPGDMPARIRSYCRRTGQPVPATVGEITRCVFESMAFKYRQAVEGIRQDAGRRVSAIHMTGGATNNPLLVWMIANATGCALHIGKHEASAVGNALMQLIALGELVDISQGREVIARSFPTEMFYPDDGAKWDEAYGRFQDATDGCEAVLP